MKRRDRFELIRRINQVLIERNELLLSTEMLFGKGEGPSQYIVIELDPDREFPCWSGTRKLRQLAEILDVEMPRWREVIAEEDLN